jgi:hypothetical protein
LELREVLAALRRLSLSFRSIGVEISVRYSTALAEALRKDSAIIVGWIPYIHQSKKQLDLPMSIPLASICSAAPKKLPARTTTLVVPSPASTSWAAERSTNCHHLSVAFLTISKEWVPS